MKKPMILLMAFCWLATSAFAQKTKQDLIKVIDARYDTYSTTAKKIWDLAEVGFQETKSSALLQQMLQEAGFTVQNNVAGMPTAFTATYGSGKPVIGFQ
jgi:aminobenzoyl-glutamate utilization protein B